MSYHHGMPFCANTTAVSSRSKGGRPMTRLLKELAFSVLMTRSCGPSAAGSLDALSFARNSPFQTRSVRPWAFTASRCGPRITQDTSCPASASRTAKWLPIAPAPKMHIRMGQVSFEAGNQFPRACAVVQPLFGRIAKLLGSGHDRPPTIQEGRTCSRHSSKNPPAKGLYMAGVKSRCGGEDRQGLVPMLGLRARVV